MITPDRSGEPWTFRVSEVVRVVDGDTIDAVLDMGFRTRSAQRLRLLYIDTPERGQDGWAEATADLAAWTLANSPLMAHVVKGDSFGRWLVDLRAETDGASCSQWMLEHGWPPYVPRPR